MPLEVPQKYILCENKFLGMGAQIKVYETFE